MRDQALRGESAGEPPPAEVIQVLVGKPMFGARRAADMQIFDFGIETPIVDRHGQHRAIGEYRLHIQSWWRLIDAGVPLVTYDDIFKPTMQDPDAPFDPDLGSRTLRDELLGRHLANTAVDERTVEEATVTEGGGLHLQFRGRFLLEIEPADPQSDDEAWRLLLSGGIHAVMSGSGFAMQRPPPTE